MTRGAELAIEVLLSEGLIVRKGPWFEFVGDQPVEVRALVQESKAVIVTPGKLPWLVERSNSTYNPVTPEQKLMCAYKLSKKIDWQSREWDKFNYKRYAKGCKKLLAAFDGSDQEAAHWLLDFGDKFDGDELTWNLDTAANHAWLQKGERDAR